MPRTRSVVTAAALVAAVVGGPGAVPFGSPAAAATCSAAGGAGVPNAAATGSGIVLQGHGWGHGLGMSQYGAQGAARLGCTHATILGTYFKGTHLARKSLPGNVVLALASSARKAVVTAEEGDVTWRAGNGKTLVQARGWIWSVAPYTLNGRSGSALLDTTGRALMWVGAGDTLSLTQGGRSVRLRVYTSSTSSASVDLRLRYDATRFVAGSRLGVTQTLVSDARGTAVQKYLWGLGEVPVSWPQEALRAQATAARTYLLPSWKSSSNAYVIGVTTAAQVYAGARHEDDDARYGHAWRQAVDATLGEVVVDAAGAVASVMYSSSVGGYSESRAYVYGSQGGYEYLDAVDDSRWDLASDNPRRSWAVTYSPASLAAKLGFTSLSSVSIGARGSSTRDGGLRATGVRGGAVSTRTFTGSQVRSLLGLNSPGITVSWSAQPSTPPPPPPPPPPAVSVDRPVVGDWDGDGRDEVGLWKDGAARLRTQDGTVVRLAYGFAGALPIAGDWDGDGTDGLAVVDRGGWYLRNPLTSGVAQTTLSYGRAGDTPVLGRWPGMSGGDGLGIFRGGTWYLRRSLSSGPGEASMSYGRRGDVALAGNVDADGATEPVIVRAGRWYVGNGVPVTGGRSLVFGRASDLPVLGDWDGDGVDTPGVYRPSTGVWYFRDDLAGGAATASTAFDGR